MPLSDEFLTVATAALLPARAADEEQAGRGAGPAPLALKLKPVQVSQAAHREPAAQLALSLQPAPGVPAQQVRPRQELAAGQSDLEQAGAQTPHELHLLGWRRLLDRRRGLRCSQQLKSQ